MASETPMIYQLKQIFGTHKLHECFKLLTVHEKLEDEAFIRYLGERRNELEAKIKIRTARMAELWSIDHDDEVAGWVIYENLRKVQIRERIRLEALTAIMSEVRDGLNEKDEQIGSYDSFEE